MNRFRGRTVLVTGAARGVGHATAHAFSAEGANVVLADSDEQRLSAAAAAMPGGSDRSAGVCADVTSSEDADAAVRVAVERFGGLDCLVNAAGVITLGRVVDLAEADWDRVMGVNAKGVFLMTRAALRVMDQGTIVNIASQAGKRAEAEAAHYCASKAAVILLTRSVALEVAPRIRVNAVCPGYVDTDMQRDTAKVVEATTGTPASVVLEEMRAEIPLGRYQQAEDVAKLVLFLASDDASEITGEDVNITGGLTMH